MPKFTGIEWNGRNETEIVRNWTRGGMGGITDPNCILVRNFFGHPARNGMDLITMVLTHKILLGEDKL